MVDPADAPGGAAAVELTTTTMAVGGDAVARTADGKVTFVTGALPGERVLATVTDVRHDFDRAVAVEILDAAPGRVTPPCPHVARGCGGCPWMHVDLAAQRRLKVELVAEALHRIGGIDSPRVEAGPRLPAEAFRTTVRLAQGKGFRSARSHDVVEVDSCLVAHPLLVELFDVDFKGAREVTLRCGARTGDRLILTEPAKIHLDVPRGIHVGPRAWLTEEVAGRRWRISARSFFQVRPDGADALVAAVRNAAAGAPAGPMIDAYGGVGLFAGTVGADRDTTLLEWGRSSVADAEVNVPGAVVVATDVARWRPHPAALVVADPPRTGLGKAAAGVLAATGASHLALVSCDPAALARDARLLSALGFAHDGTTLVDLFPHTAHVEAVSRFIRR
ncbi:MAG TPA: TRAM domain-containing protein [Acidimicrobiales bacterium]|nr:TRAM domain-containing protein [Acidimicrobiales bacterium]